MNNVYKDIVGHARLKGALAGLLEAGTMPGTVLFYGHAGVGKCMMALRTVMALHCRSEAPPCLICGDCVRLEAGVHPDSIFVAPGERGIIPIGSEEKKEGGSIRWLLERLSLRSFSGVTTAVINGADRIRPEGQNALLKTIEEPSPGTYLFLVAAGTSSLLPTILSRCMKMKFGPLRESEILGILEKKRLHGENSPVIAEICGGSAEYALRLAGESTIEDFRAAAECVSSLARGGMPSLAAVSVLEKKFGGDFLLEMLVNIYRRNLLDLVNREGKGGIVGDFFGNAFLDGTEDVVRIQKILLAARKSIVRNVGTVNALRGVAYSDEYAV